MLAGVAIVRVRSLSLTWVALSLACLVPGAARAAAPRLSAEPLPARSACDGCKPVPLHLHVQVDAGTQSVHLALRHQKASLTLATSFPAMEGATLFEGDFRPQQGSVDVSVILPIRGDWVLSAVAQGAQGSLSKAEQRIPTLAAKEVRLNLGLGAILALALGLFGGYGLGRRFWMAAGVLLWLMPGPARAHSGAMKGMDVGSQGSTVQVVGPWMAHCITEPAPFGKPATIHFQVMDARGYALKGPVSIRLDLERSRDALTIFQAETRSSDGSWAPQCAFFDATSYHLRFHVSQSEGGHSADFDFDTTVSAQQALPQAPQRPVGFLLSLFALGLAGGLAYGRARGPKVFRTS